MAVQPSTVLIPEEIAESSPGTSRAVRLFLHNPMAWVGLIGIVLIVLFSFVGPFFYRVNPLATNVNNLMAAPSAQHLLGTDDLGRDYLSRMMYGGRLSLIVGFSAAVASMIIGVTYGLISGLVGGWLDSLLMRIIDVLLSIPTLFLLLFLDVTFQPSPLMLIIILAITSWFGVTRLVRSEVLSIKQRDYVEASRAFGANNLHIMVKELLPNVIGTVMVATTFQIAGAIITIATLSFLGLGLPPPEPNWGTMLSTSMSYMYENSWWLIYPPGIALLWTVLSINFISEALRGALDSRM
ncbi:MAG: ABC transporter permease [Sulfobacillus sp.]